MDVFERFNSKFGKWYEGLFGGENSELRPKDVLRKIIAAMEDHRKEGFDSKIYVPNKYVLELSVPDPEEREYLLSFLDEEELVSVLQKFMAQNHYHTRGPLDFTIAEVPEAERADRREKLRVKVRYEKGEMPAAVPDRPLAPNSGGTRKENPAPPELGAGGASSLSEDDLPTMAGVDLDDGEEGHTVPAVAWASLAVTAPDGRKSHFSLTKPTVTIGRSRNMGNDLILDSDGMVSKTHARLERERDGRWTVYDLGSTNGVKVGGLPIRDNRGLKGGDEIQIGQTRLLFQQAEAASEAEGEARAPRPSAAVGGEPPRRARLIDARGLSHVLASETLIGRGVTADIVLEDPSVSTKHARIIAPDFATYYLEDLGSEQGSKINGVRVTPGQRTLLAPGDALTFGAAELRFAGAGQ